MPKGKLGPALFEVMGNEPEKSPAKLNVPRWWSSSDRLTEAPALSLVSGGAAAREPAQPRSTSDCKPASPARLVAFDGDRIRISLTSVAAAVAVFACAMVVVGAFEWGSQVGGGRGLRLGYEQGLASQESQPVSEIEQARSQPPATHLISDLLKKPRSLVGATTRLATRSTAPAGWVRGRTYIVAQEFHADRPDDAQRARAFLTDHGIETEAIRYSSGAVQLITTQGYDHKNPAQRSLSVRLLQDLHAVGAKYLASGGGYGLDGYFKTLKGNSW